jgi:hypothetical protein
VHGAADGEDEDGDDEDHDADLKSSTPSAAGNGGLTLLAT